MTFSHFLFAYTILPFLLINIILGEYSAIALNFSSLSTNNFSAIFLSVISLIIAIKDFGLPAVSLTKDTFISHKYLEPSFLIKLYSKFFIIPSFNTFTRPLLALAWSSGTIKSKLFLPINSSAFLQPLILIASSDTSIMFAFKSDTTMASGEVFNNNLYNSLDSYNIS